MSTLNALRDIWSEARPALEAWLTSTRDINLLFMKAWRSGLLDEAWEGIRAEYPGQYLTYFVRSRGMGDIKIGKTNHVTTREWFRPGPELMTHLRIIGCDTGAFTNAVPAHFYSRHPHRLQMGDVNTAHKISGDK